MGGQGEALVDAGAFPGIVDRAALLVAAAGLVSTNQFEAWIQPKATADHSIDDHMVENIKASATFFANDFLLVWVVNDNRLVEPVTPPAPFGSGPPDSQVYDRGAKIPRIYGVWNVGWVWN